MTGSGDRKDTGRATRLGLDQFLITSVIAESYSALAAAGFAAGLALGAAGFFAAAGLALGDFVALAAGFALGAAGFLAAAGFALGDFVALAAGLAALAAAGFLAVVVFFASTAMSVAPTQGELGTLFLVPVVFLWHPAKKDNSFAILDSTHVSPSADLLPESPHQKYRLSEIESSGNL